jgi:SAM-dependent methyltransferase
MKMLTWPLSLFLPATILRGVRVTYEPRTFWEQRLTEQFDLRGTGEIGNSIAYNRACYALRRIQLEHVLRAEGIGLAGRRVLDVGCGTGFFTELYLEHGAHVTGLDITEASIERLRERFPQAEFVRAGRQRRAAPPARTTSSMRSTCSTTSPTMRAGHEPCAIWRMPSRRAASS